MLKVRIETKNDAFEKDKGFECGRILNDVVASLAIGKTEGILHDINGGRVGEWKLTNR
jgi:hypothetical protein